MVWGVRWYSRFRFWDHIANIYIRIILRFSILKMYTMFLMRFLEDFEFCYFEFKIWIINLHWTCKWNWLTISSPRWPISTSSISNSFRLAQQRSLQSVLSYFSLKRSRNYCASSRISSWICKDNLIPFSISIIRIEHK